jgi:hypothetical protein
MKEKWFARTLLFLGIISIAVLIYVGTVYAAVTVCQVANGCTGTSTAPSFGQVLTGNSSGGYSLTATSSLGIRAASTTVLSDSNTFSGADTFTQPIVGSVSGSAATALQLVNTRTINGVGFNGASNIIVNAASSTLLTDSNTFSGSNTFSASTSVGGGTQATGLTVNGGATTTGQLNLNTIGYPQVIIGAPDTSPVSNVELNDLNQGNFASLGLKANNGGGTFAGSLLLDLQDEPSGIPEPVLVDNLTGYATCLNIEGASYACLDDYNTLSSLFAVISPPYNVSGTEAGLTTTMRGANGNDNTDYGIQQYGNTGLDAYQNYYSTTYAQPLPEPDFSFSEQANGGTSESATAWHWLVATTTPTGALGTTTAICIGDVGTTTLSAFSNCNRNGPTIQVMSSSTRTTALSVASETGAATTSLFTVNNNGNTGIGATTTPGTTLSVNNIANFAQGTSTLYSSLNIATSSAATATCLEFSGKCGTQDWLIPYDSQGLAGTSQTLTTGQFVYAEFEIDQPSQIDQLCYITGSVASGNVQMAIYGPVSTRDSIVNAPLVASTSPLAQSGTTAIQCASITTPVLPVGQYYVGLQGDNGTGTFDREGNVAIPSGWAGFFNDTYGALPSTATTTTNTASPIPGFYVRGVRPN